MMFTYTQNFALHYLTANEGVANYVYVDSKGIPTVGVGTALMSLSGTNYSYAPSTLETAMSALGIDISTNQTGNYNNSVLQELSNQLANAADTEDTSYFPAYNPSTTPAGAITVEALLRGSFEGEPLPQTLIDRAINDLLEVKYNITLTGVRSEINDTYESNIAGSMRELVLIDMRFNGGEKLFGNETPDLVRIINDYAEHASADLATRADKLLVLFDELALRSTLNSQGSATPGLETRRVRNALEAYFDTPFSKSNPENIGLPEILPDLGGDKESLYLAQRLLQHLKGGVVPDNGDGTHDTYEGTQAYDALANKLLLTNVKSSTSAAEAYVDTLIEKLEDYLKDWGMQGSDQSDQLFDGVLDGNDDFVPGSDSGIGEISGIFGGNGDDEIRGFGGDDILYGEDGNDTIYGGDDNDVISGGVGNDIIYADGGDDSILLEDAGVDKIDGGTGTDTLYVDSFTGFNDATNRGAVAGLSNVEVIIGDDVGSILNVARQTPAEAANIDLSTIQNMTDILRVQGGVNGDVIVGSGLDDVIVTAGTVTAGGGDDRIALQGGTAIYNAGDGHDTVSGTGTIHFGSTINAANIALAQNSANAQDLDILYNQSVILTVRDGIPNSDIWNPNIQFTYAAPSGTQLGMPGFSAQYTHNVTSGSIGGHFEEPEYSYVDSNGDTVYYSEDHTDFNDKFVLSGDGSVQSRIGDIQAGDNGGDDFYHIVSGYVSINDIVASIADDNPSSNDTYVLEYGAHAFITDSEAYATSSVDTFYLGMGIKLPDMYVKFYSQDNDNHTFQLKGRDGGWTYEFNMDDAGDKLVFMDGGQTLYTQDLIDLRTDSPTATTDLRISLGDTAGANLTNADGFTKIILEKGFGTSDVAAVQDGNDLKLTVRDVGTFTLDNWINNSFITAVEFEDSNYTDLNVAALLDLTHTYTFSYTLPWVDINTVYFANGNGSSEYFSGTAAAEIITPYAGTDIINGAGGDDTVRIGRGFGVNTITDTDGANRIEFMAGINPADIVVTQVAGTNNLMLQINGTQDAVIVPNWFSATTKPVVAVEFDSGTTWSAAQIDAFVRNITGTAADEFMEGHNGYDEVFDGAGGNDYLRGLSGDDTLIGGAGNDVLEGGDGNDNLTGGTDDDYLDGGEGDDVLTGGAGDDIIATGYGQDTIHYALGDGTDFIESVGSGGQNTLVVSGINASNISLVLDANSTIAALTFDGSSDYIFIEGFTSATISTFVLGGQSYSYNDMEIDYYGTLVSDTLYAFSNNTDNLYGDDGNDVLHGNTGADNLFGEDGDDTLYGNSGENALFGGAGNDTLYAASGLGDILDGGDGDDYVYGSTGDDFIYVGEGADYFDGGDGDDDFIVEGEGSFSDTFYGGLGYDVISGTSGNDSLKVDIIADIEEIDLGAGYDTLRASNSSDVFDFSNTLITNVEQVLLRGGDDAIILSNLGDITTLDGGDGTDVLIGTAGNDFIDYTGRTVTGFEEVSLDAGNDTFIGGAGADFVKAGDGDDSVSTGGGNDTIYVENGADYFDAGDGDDTFIVDGDGSFSDTYIGGLGYDTILGSVNWDVVKVDAISGIEHIDLGAGTDLIRGANSADNIDFSNTTLVGVEAIDLRDGDDSLTLSSAISLTHIDGGAGVDQILGSAGSDNLDFRQTTLLNIETISTLGGDDTVYSSLGDDTILTGSGNDTIYVGEGTDYFDGGDGDDTFIVEGEGSYSDTYIGGLGFDVIQGSIGDDSIKIEAISGIEEINGGDGNDLIRGSVNADVWDFSAMTVSGIETIDLRSGDDVFAASFSADTIIGGTGNDTLSGRGGADTYIFNLGDGQDTINEQGDALGVLGGSVDVVSFGAGIAAADVTFSEQSGHLVVSIDNTTDKITIINWNQSGFEVEEFRFADGSVIHFNHLPAILAGTGKATNVGQLIEGTELDDTLTDTTGNDIVVGLAGGDTLTGGAGDDVLFGREGDDTLSGGAGNDWLYGNAGSDEYQFDAGFGADIILDQAAVGETNHVTFGNGIATADATFSQVGNNLQVAFDGTTDSLTVQNWFVDSSWQTTQFSFADSTNVAGGDVANIIANGGKVIIPLNEINGTSGSDTLNGTASGDLINALDGNDIVYAEGGDDTVYGGAGADSLHGGTGDDTIYGEAGDDYIYGSDGDDHIYGGTGLDILYGGSGSDTYYFNIGDGEKRIVDSVEAGQVNKVVFGAGIFKADLQISSIQEDDLVIEITVQSTGDKIRIFDWNDVNGFPINQFEFVEAGESLTVQEANDAFRIQYGTAGDDIMNAGVLDDIIYANAGNDTVRTAEGDDELYGGDGNDNLYSDKGSSGTDVGSGNDLLNGGTGDDNLYAGAGDDTLIAGAGSDHMRGEAGNDTYQFNMGDGLNFVYDNANGSDTNTILFGAGIVKSDLSINRNGSSTDIEIISTGEIMRIANWDSWNPIQAFSFTESGESLTLAEVDQMLNTYEGTTSVDTMIGNSNNETFYGYEDNDNIYAGLGNDTLYGGDGADKLYSDHTSGTTLPPNGGDDIVYGGAGNDSIKAGGGDDILYGEADNDNLNGGDGNDFIYGGIGNDINSGGNGDDYLDGGDGIDYLQGGNDNDILVFDAIDAQIYGHAGEDTLLLATGGESADLSNTKIRYIERVDMTNSDGGTDQITLTMADVLRVSDTDIMRITGDAGDQVTISDTLTRGADTTLDNVDFASFTASGATLYVQLGLDMNGTQVQAA